MGEWIHNYSNIILSAVASQITGVAIVYSTVCSGADQWKRSATLAFVRGGDGFPSQRASNAKKFSFWNPLNLWHVIAHTWHDFNGSLNKHILKSRHGRVISSRRNLLVVIKYPCMKLRWIMQWQRSLQVYRFTTKVFIDFSVMLHHGFRVYIYIF